MTLLELPPEILVNIYCNLANVDEATQLAQTCSAMNAILKQSFNYQKIFQSIISGENVREENGNVRGKPSSQVVYYYYLPILTSKQDWTKFAATCSQIGRSLIIHLIRSRCSSS
jgi:hypothetical protein